jgi:hypothetical protein
MANPTVSSEYGIAWVFVGQVLVTVALATIYAKTRRNHRYDQTT